MKYFGFEKFAKYDFFNIYFLAGKCGARSQYF